MDTDKRKEDQKVANESEQMLLDNIVPFRNPEVVGANLKIEKYFLPRTKWCVSERFIEIMNKFATRGGFHLIIRALRTPPNTTLSIKCAHHLSVMVSMVHQLFH